MRPLPAFLLSSCSVALALSAATGCEILDKTLGQDSDAGTATPAATGDASASVDSGIVGGGCGVETQTGATLCVATSMCPTLVVDTEAMPHCGFRIVGAKADLVCACGSALCPMGVYSTCSEAAQLLATQTEQGVCVQLAEERCFDLAGTGITSPSSSSSSSGSNNPACNMQCVRDCGGGAACAAVCNCD